MKYKPFGKHTGLLASEVILGAASMGTRRGHGSSPAESLKCRRNHGLDQISQVSLGYPGDLLAPVRTKSTGN